MQVDFACKNTSETNTTKQNDQKPSDVQGVTTNDNSYNAWQPTYHRTEDRKESLGRPQTYPTAYIS